MERPTLELTKGLKPDSCEGMDVLCGILGSADRLTEVSIRKADSHTDKVIMLSKVLEG
jgi:hypothetical protein